MSGLSIVSATYGTGSTTVDVTTTVASKVKDGFLNFTVSPTALNVNDPAPGQLKELTITYTINSGSSNTKTIKDNDLVYINAPPARLATGLQITTAEYGYTGNYTDVTDAVQNYVKDGSIDMKVGFKEVGIPDPNPNKPKELKVSYTVNGASATDTIRDGGRLRISAPTNQSPDNKTPSQHATSFLGMLFSNVARFFGTFLYALSIFVAIKFGDNFISPLLWGGIAFFVPFFSFWALPIITFWIRLFSSSDIVTPELIMTKSSLELGLQSMRGTTPA